MLVIGLGTSKRVGKDSLASHIIEKRGGQMSIMRLAFADAVKQECSADFLAVFPTSGPFMSNETLKGAWRQWCIMRGIKLDRPVEVDFDDPLCPYGKCRQALQWWGSEYRRAQDPDYWIDIAQKKLLDVNPDVAVITDVRFPNEFNLIRGLDRAKFCYGEVWKLHRIYPKGEEPPKDNHPSETLLDGYDFDRQFWAPNLDSLFEYGLETFDLLTSK